MFSIIHAGYTKIKNFWQSKGSLLGTKIRTLFLGHQIDETTLEKLEEILYQADLGNLIVETLMQHVQKVYKHNGGKLNSDALIQLLQQQILALLPTKNSLQNVLEISLVLPHVIMVIGSNGHGKTTSVAKLAYYYKQQGYKVLLIAADTFRAAACEQLTLWSEQLQIDIVKGKAKSDPAAVIFDGLTAAQARGMQIVLIDTAGRLPTKVDLMQELEKFNRVAKKALANAPHETLLVLDATTGSNAVEQARLFHTYTPITGIVLSKLDGTARGGSIFAIQQELGIAVRWIGLGEKMSDLEVFDPTEFVKALFE